MDGSESNNSGTATFIAFVWGLLHDAAYAHVIGWAPAGTSFVIHDPER